jgi:NADPH2:quinone reductase
MRAAVYYETGGPGVFRYEEVDDPGVPDDGVLIDVEAISIEGGDTLSRAGGQLRTVPHVVGYQCAGTVIGVGPGAGELAVGDRVVTVGMDGSHAERRAASRSFCWPIPEELPTDVAACIPVAFGTAHDCLFEFGRLRAGETVLVQAGASGVGIAAVQMAHRAGARVLATASSDTKLERLRGLGLDEGINYARSDLISEVRRLTAGRGVDLVLESVGGAGLNAAVACLAYRGRCVSIGDAGRDGATSLDVGMLRPGNATLTGYYLGAELATGDRAHAMVADIITQVAAGNLTVVVDRRFPLAEAADAHAYIEDRRAFGRVLLVP